MSDDETNRMSDKVFFGVGIPLDRDDKATPIVMPTDILLVAKGLDAEGESVYSVYWNSSRENGLPEYLTGLGMCEAAKDDFRDRCAGRAADES